MDEYRKTVQKVQRALNQDAAFIRPDPFLAQRVLRAANADNEKEGEVVVKKKLSIGFVIVMIFILSAVTALAIGLVNYFGGFAALEDTYGEYEQWSDSAKVELVRLMHDSGVLSAEETQCWQQAQDASNQSAAADEVLAMHFAGMTYLDTYHVMARELGPIEAWSDENRALYTSLLQQYGKYGADWPVYVTPAGQDLTRDEAVARAREAVLTMFSIEPAELDQMVVDAIFAVDAYNTVGAPLDEPFWEVDFGYGLAYRVYMTRHGEMLGMMGPKTLFYPWNCAMDEGATAAEIASACVSAEEAVIASRQAPGEIMNVSYESLDAMDVTARVGTGPPYCHGMYCRYSSVRSASRQRHSPCRAARSALATMPLFTRAVFIWFRGCLPASSRRGPCPASAAQSNAPLRTDTAFQTPQSPFC